jgi:hypothetical protein
MDAGWSILQIEGEKEELERAFDYLTDKGVKIQQIKIDKK